MKTLLIIAITLALVAVISGFVHHDHSHGHDHEGTDEGEEDHHHRHHHGKHHHHKHHHKHHHHWKCMGESVNTNEDLVKAKKECHQEFQEDKENDVADRHKGRTCKSLCAGKKIGFFDQDGQIVESKVNDLIESIIESSEAQTEIKEKAALCASNSTQAIANGPSDVTCSNYKPYMQCLFFSTMEVCVKGFDREDWE